MYKIKKDKKLISLLREGRELYHTQDLGVLWGISNENTLYTTIKRYIKSGVLFRVHKGLYSIKKIDQIDKINLGLTSLHRYGYLSTESVLVKAGIIFQDIKYITFVSDISRKFKINGNHFLVRKMNPIYLYNNVGIYIKNNQRIASTERAVADMIYFNPKYHFDGENIIDWEKVKEIKKQIGY